MGANRCKSAEQQQHAEQDTVRVWVQANQVVHYTGAAHRDDDEVWDARYSIRESVRQHSIVSIQPLSQENLHSATFYYMPWQPFSCTCWRHHRSILLRAICVSVTHRLQAQRECLHAQKLGKKRGHLQPPLQIRNIPRQVHDREPVCKYSYSSINTELSLHSFEHSIVFIS